MAIIGVFLLEWKMKQNFFLFAETAYEAHKKWIKTRRTNNAFVAGPKPHHDHELRYRHGQKGESKNKQKNGIKLEVKHYAYPKKRISETQLTWLSSPGCGSFWFLEIAKISISSLKGELSLNNFLRHSHIKSSQNYPEYWYHYESIHGPECFIFYSTVWTGIFQPRKHFFFFVIWAIICYLSYICYLSWSPHVFELNKCAKFLLNHKRHKQNLREETASWSALRPFFYYFCLLQEGLHCFTSLLLSIFPPIYLLFRATKSTFSNTNRVCYGTTFTTSISTMVY